MHPKLPDILTNREALIENEDLVRYLNNDLDDKARHELEKQLTDGNQMEQDALEGWQQTHEPEKIIVAAEDINRKLARQFHPTLPHKRKKPITQLPVVWWVFGLLLIIILLAWVMISISA